MPISVDRDLLFRLIQSSTSIAVVSDFLKRRQLPHSAGSWEDMFSLRLGPYVNDAKISIEELVELLRTVEEYGRQHIFLYRTTPQRAQDLLDRTSVLARLNSLSLAHLVTSPSLYDHPSVPTISDVRWVTTSQGHDVELVIKEIQSREHYRLLNVTHSTGGMIKNYAKEQERGVNIARLHRSGQLEIRIAARSGSVKYSEDLRAFRIRLRELLSPDGFAEVSLQKAKDVLWQSRSSYEGKIRFSEVSARNDEDYVLKAAGGSLESNVGSNEASVTSMGSFIASSGRCESFNLWFSKEHTPSKRDVHFLLSGEVNEFAINANCTQEDYEYVLSELRSLNT